MVFNWKDRKWLGGIILGVVTLGVVLVMVYEESAKKGSEVEGVSDRGAETAGALQPVVGKLEYSVPGQVSGNEVPVISSQEAEAVMKAVGTNNEVGWARKNMAEGKLTVSLEVNLKGPVTGKVREAWLVRQEPAMAYYSLGWLAPQNGKYGLMMEGELLNDGYDKIIVTEETERFGRDGIPERVLLEGTFE